MTENAKIVMLETMIGDEETDEEILSAYLELAGQAILNRMYPYKEDYEGMKVPARYENIQLHIAIYLLGKRSAEGQIQHIENGIHRNYGDAHIPDSMLRDIVPYAQAIR